MESTTAMLIKKIIHPKSIINSNSFKEYLKLEISNTKATIVASENKLKSLTELLKLLEVKSTNT